jgi:hypothetical protein
MACLNYGDCFAYALAVVAAEPLLFKGDNFSHTDIVTARISTPPFLLQSMPEYDLRVVEVGGYQ